MGLLFVDLHPPPAPPRICPRVLTYIHTQQLCHTQLCHTLSHTTFSHGTTLKHTTLSHIVTHNCSHTTFSHTTTLSHTTLSHIVTHNLSHTTFSQTTTLSHTTFSHTTTLSHTTAHTQPSHTQQLCHTQLCHTLSHTTYHTQPSHTQQLCHTHTQLLTHKLLTHNLLTHNFVAHNFVTHNLHTHTHTHNFVTQLSHTQLCHTQPAWYLWDWADFAWQAWHLATSAFVSRGWRGTWWHPPSFCVAGVLLMGLGWLWWRPWISRGTAALLRGRRGTWRHPPSFHVAGVALGDIYRRFTWQAWYLWDWAGSGGALGSPVAPRHFCVAGVSLGDICRHFTWQGWHLAVVLMGLGWLWWRAWHLATSAVVWCHPPSFHVARVVLMGLVWLWWRPWISRGAAALFAWQAWQLVTSAVVSRGRRGSWWHPPSLCVAGVVLMGLRRTFAWQAWHLVTSAVVSRGWRGTWRHPPSFCAAGVLLMGLIGSGDALGSPVTPRHFAWQAWHLVTSAVVSVLLRCLCLFLCRADQPIVGCHLVGRGCGRMRSCVLGANARFHFETGHDGKDQQGQWANAPCRAHAEREAICNTPRLRPAGGRQCDVHRSIVSIKPAWCASAVRQLLLACLLPSVHTLLAQCGKTWWLHRGGERSWCRLILTHCGKKSCKGCVAQSHSNACFLTMRSAPRGVVLDVKDYGVACVMQQLSSNSMTTLSRTIIHTHLRHTFFHTHLCHARSWTHNIFNTHLRHTSFRTHLCHTPFFTHAHAHTHTHLYRKASRILDLECTNRANQQQRWNPVKKWSESSVEFWNGHQQRSEMNWSSWKKFGMVVLGLATSHDRKSKIAGTFSPPCCLVFVGQDRQSWVPGPLQKMVKKPLLKVFEKQSKPREKGNRYRFYIYWDGSHTRPAAARLFRTVLEEQRGHGNLRFQNA